MYFNDKTFPRSFEDKLRRLYRLGHFVSDRWPEIDEGTWYSIKSVVKDEHNSDFGTATESLQRYTGRLVDGKYGEETIGEVRDRVCGVPDIMSAGGLRKWSFLDVGVWCKTAGQKGIARNLYMKGCERWNEVTRLQMHWNEVDQPNIFCRNGLSYIDGPGGTLAKSMLPAVNASRSQWCEQWYETVRDDAIIITHEVGHAIGLSHSKNRVDVMFFSLGNSQVDLGPGDILDSQRRYGRPGELPPPPPPPPNKNLKRMVYNPHAWVDDQRLIDETWIESRA